MVEDNSFDVVMATQMLHHLPIDENDRDGAIKQAMKEIHRVLKPGGFIIINTSSTEQIQHGMWFAILLPIAIAEMTKRMYPVDQLTKIMSENFTGLEQTPNFELLQPLPVDLVREELTSSLRLVDEQPDRPPLTEGYLKGDSTWSLSTDEEINQAQVTLSTLLKNGGIFPFFAERQKETDRVGQTTFIVGQAKST